MTMEKIRNYFKNTAVSTHVFRAVLIFILVAGIIGTIVIYNYLDSFFGYYESSRPKHLAEEYFNEIMDPDDRSVLYKAAGFGDNSPVSLEEFSIWFDTLIKDKTVKFRETSAGLSGNAKYLLTLDGVKFGEFLLVTTGIQNAAGFDILSKGEVSVTLPDENAYIIRVRSGSEVTVNGKILDEKYVYEKGNLISGEYTIYKVNCIVNKPTISVKYDGGDCYMINAGGSDRIITDEYFDDPIGSEDITTIRAIKGHTVIVDGKTLDDSSLVEGANGSFPGYYKGNDTLEYLVYSYRGKAQTVVIKDENGNERTVEKIAGGNIYTDASIVKKGTIEFSIINGSIPYFDGIRIDDKYIVEKDIKTESCKYMYKDIKGITYDRYLVNWAGDMPELQVVNKYSNTAKFETVNGLPTEIIEYDAVAYDKFSSLIIEAAQTYSKMMANDASESKALKYFDPEADIYQKVKDNPSGFFTNHDSYAFLDTKVEKMYVYSDNVFSGSISFVHTVTKNGKVTSYPFSYTFYFRQVGEKYLIYQMVNNG